jgi:hypothetical protein
MIFRGFLILMLCGVMAGCGGGGGDGGGGGGTPPDTTTPTVSSTTPPDGATEVAVNTTVSATFSEAMDPATVSTTTFTLSGSGGAVSGTVSYSGATATFTPSASLTDATTYTATITTGAKDAAGNALSSNYTWSFTTAATGGGGGSSDTTPPTVLSTLPGDGASQVAIHAPMSATFSETMDVATLTGATFTLSGPGGAVSGTVSYNNSAATFTPSAHLTPNTPYTATITMGATDAAGNPLTADHSWSFTTVTPFTKTVELPTVGQGDWIGLFYSNPSGARYQGLVLSQDIGGSGFITALSFRFGLASTGNSCPDVTIRMGQTSVSTLSTTYANNTEEGRGSLVTVYGPATLAIPSGAVDAYFTVPLNGMFYYNGRDNLVVEITSGTCTGGTSLKARAGSTPYTALIYDNDSASTTGSTWNTLAHMKFEFAGGVNTIAYTDSGDLFSINNIPLTTDPAQQKVQLLYGSSEVGGSGLITGLSFPVGTSPRGGTTSTARTYTLTVTLGHTTLTSLTSTFSSNFDSGLPVTVASAVSFTVPAGVSDGSHVWIPLPDGAFFYNGTDNLVVEIITVSATGATPWIVDSLGSGTRVYGASSATTGTVEDARYHIRFRFHGGAMDVNTPTGITGFMDAFPFNDPEGKRQYLSLSGELGSPGTISRIACRAADSVAETGFDYTVVMSHTTATTLTADFGANLISPVTVFSGLLSTPTVLRGDYLEIPLSTPFNYNGRDNLIVEIAGTGGTVGGGCVIDTTSTVLYASRRVFATSSTALTGSVTNSMVDLRFVVQQPGGD